MAQGRKNQYYMDILKWDIPTIMLQYGLLKSRVIFDSPYRPDVCVATVKSSEANNNFYFQITEVGMWMMSHFTGSTVDCTQLVTRVLLLMDLLSLFNLLFTQKVSTHKYHDFTLPPCL